MCFTFIFSQWYVDHNAPKNEATVLPRKKEKEETPREKSPSSHDDDRPGHKLFPPSSVAPRFPTIFGLDVRGEKSFQ